MVVIRKPNNRTHNHFTYNNEGDTWNEFTQKKIQQQKETKQYKIKNKSCYVLCIKRSMYSLILKKKSLETIVSFVIEFKL